MIFDTTAPRHHLRRALVCTALAAATGSVALFPRVAVASPLDELKELQEEIRQSNEAYEAAVARVDELEGQMSSNEERISQIEDEMPALKERAADSMRVLYKMQQGTEGLLELLLSAESFNDLVAMIQYLDVVQAHNSDAIDALASTALELEEAQADLKAQTEEARQERQAAADALASAEEARDKVQAQIDAQAAAEEAERQAALEAAQAALEAAQNSATDSSNNAGDSAGSGSTGPTFETESGGKAEIEVPSDPNPEPAPTPSEKDAFVSLWTPRINAFLAGSPMAGTGKTFAEAAWTYGVDPRFSPAIAAVESSTGLYCFKPHNAWGWGTVSWSSWEDAIWDHVAGLASGYGGQLTYAAAQKYCPPNAGAWYSSVLANMEKI